jgi:hypothetical protein
MFVKWVERLSEIYRYYIQAFKKAGYKRNQIAQIIKSLLALTQSSDKIIVSLLDRFELISNTLISEYNINPSRLVSPIDFSIKIDINS